MTLNFQPSTLNQHRLPLIRMSEEVRRKIDALFKTNRLDHQMKMIRHVNVGVNLPARFGTSLAECLDERCRSASSRKIGSRRPRDS